MYLKVCTCNHDDCPCCCGQAFEREKIVLIIAEMCLTADGEEHFAAMPPHSGLCLDYFHILGECGVEAVVTSLSTVGRGYVPSLSNVATCYSAPLMSTFDKHCLSIVGYMQSHHVELQPPSEKCEPQHHEAWLWHASRRAGLAEHQVQCELEYQSNQVVVVHLCAWGRRPTAQKSASRNSVGELERDGKSCFCGQRDYGFECTIFSWPEQLLMFLQSVFCPPA